MEFFGRNRELAILKQIEQQSLQQSVMTVVMGRRRTGKTWLLRQAYGDNCLYLMAQQENECTMCSTFQQQIQDKLGITVYGTMPTMREVFEVLLKHSIDRPCTVVIDEFQEFYYVRKSIYADLQELWDRYAPQAHLNLVVCGSIFTLMTRLMRSPDECLYGRASRFITLQPFTTDELKEILHKHNSRCSADDLLCLYAMTGGVAKYVADMMDTGANSREKMWQAFADCTMPFVREGKELMNMEFRRDSGNYYSLLQLLASGVTQSSRLADRMQTTVTAYLSLLENTYSLVRKRRPMFAADNSRVVRYEIADNFLLFWFRFIFPHEQLVEMQRSDLLYRLIADGYSQFSGLALERYFRQRTTEQGNYHRVGNYWDASGENEIDLIALDEQAHKALVAEVNRKKISLNELQYKARKIEKYLSRYQVQYLALSLDDM